MAASMGFVGDYFTSPNSFPEGFGPPPRTVCLLSLSPAADHSAAFLSERGPPFGMGPVISFFLTADHLLPHGDRAAWPSVCFSPPSPSEGKSNPFFFLFRSPLPFFFQSAVRSFSWAERLQVVWSFMESVFFPQRKADPLLPDGSLTRHPPPPALGLPFSEYGCCAPPPTPLPPKTSRGRDDELLRSPL